MKYTIKKLREAGMHTVAYHNLNDEKGIKCDNPQHPRHNIAERNGFESLA